MPKTIQKISDDAPYQDLDMNVLDLIDFVGATELRTNFQFRSIYDTVYRLCVAIGDQNLISGIPYHDNVEDTVRLAIESLLGGSGGGAPLGGFPETAIDALRLSSWSDSNTTETVTASFAPADVILADNRINIADIGFAQAAGNTSPAVRVTFSSTGTLPTDSRTSSPLSGNYYLSPNGSGGYDVYPECTSSNWAALFPNIPHAVLEETPTPAQNYIQRVNKVIFSDQGTGSHSLTSFELTNELQNLITGGFCRLRTQSSNKHDRIEIQTISGKKALISRILHRDPTNVAGYNLNGQGVELNSSDTTELNNFDNALLRNKDCIYQIAVFTSTMTDTFGLAKVPITPDAVNTTTGVISYTAHSMSDQWRVRLTAIPSGELPAGLSAGVDYWVCSVTANTMTLHTSFADAAGTGTNPVIPTTQGTGGFTIVAVERPADSERMRFVAEIRDAIGGNTATSRFNSISSGDNTLILSSDFVVSGGSNGNVGATGRTILGMSPTDTSIGEANIWFPAASVPPVALDGLPLTGTVWVTRSPGSSAFARLHRTLADATASLGVVTSSATCIKYDGTVGSGFVRIENKIRNLSVSVESTSSNNEGSIPFPKNNEKCVYANIIRYNDPAATFIETDHYINGVFINTSVTTTTKRKTSGTLAGSSPFTLFNSPQKHVVFEGVLFDLCMGSKASGIITYAEIADKVNWYKSAHGIP